MDKEDFFSFQHYIAADKVHAFLTRVAQNLVPIRYVTPWYNPSRYMKMAMKYISTLDDEVLTYISFFVYGSVILFAVLGYKIYQQRTIVPSTKND